MGLFDLLRRPAEAVFGEAEPYRYPLDRSNERTYPEDFQGTVYVWDIDKTYLVTEFDSLRGLLAIPFEFAVDKRNVAGTDALLRALRRSGDLAPSNPIYFISGSPSQLRGVIEKKMTLDGVEYDGITFKDHLRILRSRNVARIKEQIGYKLSALLLNRRELPWGVEEVLFGDDSESDALIYAIYADVIAGRLRGDELKATLLKNHVALEDATYAVSLSAGLPKRDLVRCVYINLEKRTSLSRFNAFGSRVVPCYDTLQASLHLFQCGRIASEHVVMVAAELVNSYDRHPSGLVRSAIEITARGVVSAETIGLVWEDLRAARLVPKWLSVDLDAARVPTARPPSGPSSDFLTPTDKLALGA